MTRTRLLAGAGFAGLIVIAGLASPTLSPARAESAVAPAQQRGLAVTVTTAETREVVRKVLVAGSFVARDEILVSPEIDGLAILEILAEEGQGVAAGQVLARLNRTTLDVQLAQNAASLARADAAVAQAQASVAEAEANSVQAHANLARSETLKKSGFSSQELIDQRTAAARSTEARLAAAKDALAAARADRMITEAARRDIEVKLARCEIKAPRGGVISRRSAKLGAIAAMAAEPLFRIIADNAVELEAEVAEAELAIVSPGQKVEVRPATEGSAIMGAIRLVSPEVDRASRLGKIRVSLPKDAPASVGGFGRGVIEAARRTGVTLPLSAIAYTRHGPVVQVVQDGRVATRQVEIGLVGAGLAEIASGLKAGEQVVARAGVFVRDGDHVTAIVQPPESRR